MSYCYLQFNRIHYLECWLHSNQFQLRIRDRPSWLLPVWRRPFACRVGLLTYPRRLRSHRHDPPALPPNSYLVFEFLYQHSEFGLPEYFQLLRKMQDMGYEDVLIPRLSLPESAAVRASVARHNYTQAEHWVQRLSSSRAKNVVHFDLAARSETVFSVLQVRLFRIYQSP